jgi:hypothetical protein
MPTLLNGRLVWMEPHPIDSASIREDSTNEPSKPKPSRIDVTNRGAQTAFILFSTFLDLRPVSAANDLQTSINGQLEIRISKSKTPV